MTIDASAVARVLGIDMQFEDMRSGSALFLPQRIAVIAQGQTGVTFSTDKWSATSAGAAGARFGFRSPIYQIMTQLMPANGDGVGTVAVDVFPMEDDDAGVAAVGRVTPSGTATKAGAYRPRISGVLGNKFTIPEGVVDVTDACRKIGEAVNDVAGVPMKATYNYGAVTFDAGDDNVGNGTVGTGSVTGEAMPGDHQLVYNDAEDGTWTLIAPDGSIISQSIETDTDGVTVVQIAGLQFTITDGGTGWAAGDTWTITVPATYVILTSGWKGESANDLVIEILGDSLGVTFAIIQPTGGLANPTVDASLAQFGNVWETMVLNALNIEDADALDAIQTVGEGRWDELVRKPFVAFTGNTTVDKNEAVVVSDSRSDDRINSQLVAPGSVNLPCVVAARQLARIARQANNNPPTGYGGLKATGLIPGTDGEQWYDYATRDAAVKDGSSTIEVVDGVVTIDNVVTFYHPVGEEPPAYRQVVNIVKLQNVLFNLDVAFSAPEWAAAPLIPNDQPTVNPNARKPRSAITEAAAVLDGLGLEAIISDPATAKKTLVATIDSANPDRLNLSGKFQVSGNTHVKAVELKWGFFFGQAA